ncbi:hypothetical protein [Polynucleobacter sp. AP-Sving-400A-A2]|uniref:hypothetical protein n=1 Tax=Polynucleobacter sp. AP-Sving-400A-A2 TaxID=2081049 RepID=UPI001BFDC129|nr:hypothetical protein [Polynucleobacter sp. AP-Sving-400A-A2]QWE14365.1 hypothetical protein C2758_09420 [Polynucleobacter sp. AP-Sving-400A-A2]
MKFTKLTEFIDYEGMPITHHLHSERELEDEFIKGICYCWDSLPPRTFDLSSARRNGAPCDEVHFRELVKKCLLNEKNHLIRQMLVKDCFVEKKDNQTKQLLLYAHWFDESATKAETLKWLKGLTNDEIIILVGATFPQLSKQEEILDSAKWQDFQKNIINAFRENTEQMEITNSSFLTFIEEYEKQVLALI